MSIFIRFVSVIPIFMYIFSENDVSLTEGITYILLVTLATVGAGFATILDGRN